MAIKKPINYMLGALVKAFPKTQYEKISEIIDKLNAISSNDNVVTVDTVNTVSGNNLVLNEGLTTVGGNIEKHLESAVNVSATVTGAQLATGFFTSTSAATVTLTLPTATDAGTALGAGKGTSFDFIVDNSAGANTVTVAVNTGIVAATPVITGGGTLTVSVANGIGVFRLVFTSATTARLFRIG